MRRRPEAPIRQVLARSFEFPLERTHSDGTLEWRSITLVLVEIQAGGRTGIGYTYADRSTAVLIQDTLVQAIGGQDAFDIPRCWDLMAHRIRNLGRPGIASMAISAVDAALWDLKAKLLDVALLDLLGACRDAIPVYGSGGLTSASSEGLEREFSDWMDQGVRKFKMKIGRDPGGDFGRVKQARGIIGQDRELFVDGNGAYARKDALEWAERLHELGVRWFEEPVSSDDLAGLRWLREFGPAGMSITAGEYGYDLPYFERMLAAEAVDVLQADASRCAGITGFLAVAALCQARGIALSSHTAPSLHSHACCASIPVRHLEYFADHVAIEQKIFDGMLRLEDGQLRPDRSRPGLGITFKEKDAAKLAA